MKTIFNKLSKIMFILGIIALIAIVLIISDTSKDTIEGIQGTVMFACLIIIFLFCIFAAVSVVLAFIEGLKKDKVAFLKKFVSNVAWITIAYIELYVSDYFYQFPVPIKLEFGKIVFRILLTVFAIIGGEYMLVDHSKEKLC